MINLKKNLVRIAWGFQELSWVQSKKKKKINHRRAEGNVICPQNIHKEPKCAILKFLLLDMRMIPK